MTNVGTMDSWRIDPDYKTGEDPKSYNSRKKPVRTVWCQGIKMSPEVVVTALGITKATYQKFEKLYGKDCAKYLSGELKDSNRPVEKPVKKKRDRKNEGKPRKNKANIDFMTKIYEDMTIREIADKYELTYHLVYQRYLKGVRGSDLTKPSREQTYRYRATYKGRDTWEYFKSPHNLSRAVGITEYKLDKIIRGIVSHDTVTVEQGEWDGRYMDPDGKDIV